MKLRNKKTGKVVEWFNNTDGIFPNTLAKLNEEWEDYEEPKVGYIIDPMDEDYISADNSGYEESNIERAKELGIWLETEEEAKKAVEKLKAWKRLKDKGFRFRGYMRRSDWAALPKATALEDFIDITVELPSNKINESENDLNLLFGGEE